MFPVTLGHWHVRRPGHGARLVHHGETAAERAERKVTVALLLGVLSVVPVVGVVFAIAAITFAVEALVVPLSHPAQVRGEAAFAIALGLLGILLNVVAAMVVAGNWIW